MRKLFELKASLFLMFIIAIFCAFATFFESFKGSEFASKYFYGAWYFHLLLFWLVCCVIYCIYKYKLFSNLSLFLIHISFVFIFIGAVLTHFFGFEGIIHLRQSNSASSILSTKTKLKIIQNDNEISSDDIKSKLSLNDISIEFKEFSSEGSSGYIASDDLNDSAYIRLNFFKNNENYELELFENECNLVQDLNVCFNKLADGNYINFYIKDNKFYAKSNVDFKRYYQNSYENLNQEFEFSEGVYYYDDFSFNAIKLLTHAKLGYLMQGGNLQTIKLNLNDKGIIKDLVLALNQEFLYKDYKILWAQEELKLDYKIYLKRFILQTYPSSNSPKDYISELLILDNEKQINANISMNKVLDYKGIRYFQHSYDEDLKGSILSANKDLGKIPTYTGYFLLFLGCFLNLFSKKTLAYFKALSLIFMIFSANNLKADDFNSHIKLLNTLIAQDLNDRFVPFFNLSKDLCNKLDCPNKSLASEEIFRLITDVNYVNEARLIRVKNPKLKELLNCDDYAKFSDFYENGVYKLKDILKLSYAKGEANFNDFDKALLKLDESVNIFYLIFTAELFKIIPETSDKQRLLSPLASDLNLENQKLANDYISEILLAKKTNEYKNANEILEKIKNLQKIQDFLPSENQIKAEIFLNKYDVFYNLCLAYLVLFFISLFFINSKSKIIFYLSLILFIIHLALIITRGFVANFTPLSNTYEGLIYIALSSVFAGLVFRKNLLLSLCLLLSVAVLMTAHLNDINPQITNLIPVLNSPYLSIHVSLITASYGFFALSALIAFVKLVCIIIKKPYEKALIQMHLANLLGLLLLICGNFLGAIWANESWGRYWGWDSKETWSLISILIYAILVHLKLQSELIKSLFSLWSFGSILMTYFGVNYYLVGKHSYAGEQSNFNSPSWLIISVLILLIFSLVAVFRSRK